MRLVLASASPRRAELLRAAGFEFEILPADVDEAPRADESGEDYTVRVASEKAHTARDKLLNSAAVILSADTEVLVDGQILGKPLSRNDAKRMLRMLSGKAHEVMTAVVVLTRATEQMEVVTTIVQFARLSEEDIDQYVDTNEPMGKAGAYAIQGYAARFIDRIEGSWSNVVGLPIHTVHELLRALHESA